MAVTVTNTLLAGLQASYDALETKDSGKLYFCTDTMNMYKGADLYTDAIRSVTTRPGTPAVGKIYYNSSSDTLEWYDGSAWNVVRYAYTTAINSASTDEQIPTAKAVYALVQSAVIDATGSAGLVASVDAGTADATLAVTGADQAVSTITVPGVVTTPTYDATTRTITLPVSDGDDVVIALGKDIYVQSGEYDSDSQTIILTLNDGTTTIEVPAADLVDVYTGGTTTTATVSVSTDNTITAAVTLSTDSNNALVVDATNGGLLVDLSSYATVNYVDGQISTLSDEIDEIDDRVSTVEDAIATLNGDATTEGSVAYQVSQAVTNITTETDDLEDRISALETQVETNTGDISDLKAQVSTNTSNIATLQSSVETNTSNIEANADDIETLASAVGFGSF